jgi:hypothetical protein
VAETKAPTVRTDGERAAGKRRSQRVHIAIPVIVRAQSGNLMTEENTTTGIVSAHGCMVYLTMPVVKGQELFIINDQTTEEMPCTVTLLGKREGSKGEVGLEFTTPSAAFWRIRFPPEDWNSDERKLPTARPR